MRKRSNRRRPDAAVAEAPQSLSSCIHQDAVLIATACICRIAAALERRGIAACCPQAHDSERQLTYLKHCLYSAAIITQQAELMPRALPASRRRCDRLLRVAEAPPSPLSRIRRGIGLVATACSRCTAAALERQSPERASRCRFVRRRGAAALSSSSHHHPASCNGAPRAALCLSSRSVPNRL